MLVYLEQTRRARKERFESSAQLDFKNEEVMKKKDLPIGYIPSVKDAEWFINYWNELPSYSDQEKALDKLFMNICKRNDNIEDVLINLV